jgi:hypothetical protein
LEVDNSNRDERKLQNVKRGCLQFEWNGGDMIGNYTVYIKTKQFFLISTYIIIHDIACANSKTLQATPRKHELRQPIENEGSQLSEYRIWGDSTGPVLQKNKIYIGHKACKTGRMSFHFKI